MCPRDLRELAAVQRGKPRVEVVQVFGVSLPTVKRWLRRCREGADLAPRPSLGRKRRICATVEERRALWEGLEEHRESW